MKYEEWKWNDSLITNEEVVDYQHKNLFRTINDLIRACNESETPNGLLVEVALDELLKYAGFHFREEEAVMEKHNYPELAAHKVDHSEFASVMNIFKTRFDKGEEIADELITFMHRWLVNHIMNKDKMAMKFCAS